MERPASAGFQARLQSALLVRSPLVHAIDRAGPPWSANTSGGSTNHTYDAANASFFVDKVGRRRPTCPVLVSPLHGTKINSSSVTLEFKPLPGYSGPYLVRLHDSQWNGQQAPGFQARQQSALPEYHHQFHACHRAGPPWSRIQVVGAQTVFRCRRKPSSPSTRASAPPPASPNIPALVSPLNGTNSQHTVGDARVPAAGRLHGQYLVRLDDPQWNGQQAPGFQHDSNVHYLCITTTSTRVTVPVRPGATVQVVGPQTEFRRRDSAVLHERRTRTDRRPVPLHRPGPLVGKPTWTSPRNSALHRRRHRSTPRSEFRRASTPIGRQISWTAASASLRSANRWTIRPAVDGSDSATLVASAALNEPWGIAEDEEHQRAHHLIFDGNKDGREGSPSFQQLRQRHQQPLWHECHARL